MLPSNNKIKIEIQTYLMHPKELMQVAKEINEMCEKGIFQYDGAKFSFQTIVLEEPKYTEKIIDGKLCHVYQSKMNGK